MALSKNKYLCCGRRLIWFVPKVHNFWRSLVSLLFFLQALDGHNCHLTQQPINCQIHMRKAPPKKNGTAQVFLVSNFDSWGLVMLGMVTGKCTLRHGLGASALPVTIAPYNISTRAVNINIRTMKLDINITICKNTTNFNDREILLYFYCYCVLS